MKKANRKTKKSVVEKYFETGLKIRFDNFTKQR